MAVVSTSQLLNDGTTTNRLGRKYSKRQVGPPGIECPHCTQRHRIFFSSAHRRQPIYKRAVFAYLRCHACTHRFRSWRVAPALFAAMAALAFLCLGILL